MLRARDAIDRAYAQPLDVPSLAGVAHVSEAHFIRTFKATFGETRTTCRRGSGAGNDGDAAPILSIKSECLDHFVFVGEASLRRAIAQ